ncbi:MAG: protein phosphatase [bacterium]|nr:protein phosphatase [bacterium]
MLRSVAIVLIIVLFAAYAEAETHGPATTPSETSSKMRDGFSWIVHERLCGMPLPAVADSSGEDLSFLQSQQIGLLVSLTVEELPVELLGEYGMDSLHIPVPDFHAPTMEQLSEFIAAVERQMTAGGRVGVHCHAGKGRTGTFLAAYLVSRGMAAADAIAKIRELRPGSVETAAQEAAIAEFAGLVGTGEENDDPDSP